MSQLAAKTAALEDRAELILDAADRLLARYGYRKMTIDDLAKEAGIGKGTVYLHFASKEDVVLSSIDRIVRRLLEEMQRITESSAATEAKLREMLILRVMFRFDSVQHYTESISEVLRDLRAGLLERRARYFEEEAKAFATILRQGQTAGVFRRHEALPTARMLITATNALLPFNLSTRELGKRSEVENSVARIADLVLHGLLTR